jgi:hypothetical protein
MARWSRYGLRIDADNEPPGAKEFYVWRKGFKKGAPKELVGHVIRHGDDRWEIVSPLDMAREYVYGTRYTPAWKRVLAIMSGHKE